MAPSMAHGRTGLVNSLVSPMGDSSDKDMADLPLLPEIWPNILNMLPRSDLKRVNLVSYCFLELVGPFLWTQPRFSGNVISIENFKQLSGRCKSMIRSLDIAQIRGSKINTSLDKSDQELDEFIDMLTASCCSLAKFTFEGGCGGGLTCRQAARLFNNLSVTFFSTRCFCRRAVNVDQAVQVLLDARDCGKCPQIHIDGMFHRRLCVHNWESMTRLPIVEIDGYFRNDTDLRAYDRYVGKISPPPKFVLLGKKSDERFSPQELDCFQTVQITELSLRALSDENVAGTVEVLKRNRQNPAIQRVDRPGQLELFWDFKVMELDSCCAQCTDLMHPDWDNFIDLLVRKHATGAIDMLKVGSCDKLSGVFSEQHKRKLKAVGLKFEETKYRFFSYLGEWF